MKRGNSDDFQTPPIALKPLIPYLKKNWLIWECASGEGYLKQGLQDYGFKVVYSDILGGQDFLNYQPLNFDCIITNPPFSLKQQFLERCYKLGKPFGLLLPLTTFETSKRQELFKAYGLEVIFFDKRINFFTPSGKGSGSWFSSAWFTNGLNIGKSFTFEKLEREQTKLI